MARQASGAMAVTLSMALVLSLPLAVALRIDGQAPQQQCDVHGRDRSDCGHYGIDQWGCEAKGCCYRQTEVHGAPWCFHPAGARAPATQGQCAKVQELERRDCGFVGVTQHSCEAKGCCFAPSNLGRPWCFHPAAEGQPVQPPQDPATQGQCAKVQEFERRDCGFVGVTQHSCQAKGCCFAPSNFERPWCFHPAAEAQPVQPPQDPATQGQCAKVQEFERRDCGFYGDTQQSCEAKGCCFAPSNLGRPWCFHPAAEAQPMQPSQDSEVEEETEQKKPMPEPQRPSRQGAASGLDLPAASPKGAGMVFVHLFEWRWDDIARECEDFLGPKGYTAVQVSPPNEHKQGDFWWTRYQPVSYKLVSRSGNEAAFASMVRRCSAAGVGVYVDAVINHMAHGSGVGVGGSQFGGRSYAQYSPRDFHHRPGNEQRNCGVHNYNNKHEVQYCDLVGLPDLRTGSSYVQEQIAAYINRMAELGVAGFRVDAAKHIDAGELRGILRRVDGRLFRFLEVIGHKGEAVMPQDYYGLGSITEFNFAENLGRRFQRQDDLARLKSFHERWGLMPAESAVIFIDNHDTQRGHAGSAVLTHKQRAVYTLANIFMLAHPYGYPKVMSSYHFDHSDQGPPRQGVHTGSELNCGRGKPWACEHRWPALANMVAWRASAGDAGVEHFKERGGSAVFFCRGGRACVAINRHEGEAWEFTARVEVPEGRYCNVVASDDPDACEHVLVGPGGRLRAAVPPMGAVAFHVGVPATAA